MVDTVLLWDWMVIEEVLRGSRWICEIVEALMLVVMEACHLVIVTQYYLKSSCCYPSIYFMILIQDTHAIIQSF